MTETFKAHNRGWNNRTTTMNHDVWLMLLGFNIDYWEHKDVEKAIAEFGRLLIWEEDPNHLARIIIKARVVDLTEIPWFLVCSEGENFEGDSWTAQVEILKINQLSGGPLGEDDPPIGPDDVQPSMFEFFGFGDLNEHLDDDLGGIDDLFNAADNLDEQPPFGPMPKDIIVEDVHSDAESNDQAIPVNDPANVEVFIPLEPINPEEI